MLLYCRRRTEGCTSCGPLGCPMGWSGVAVHAWAAAAGILLGRFACLLLLRLAQQTYANHLFVITDACAAQAVLPLRLQTTLLWGHAGLPVLQQDIMESMSASVAFHEEQRLIIAGTLGGTVLAFQLIDAQPTSLRCLFYAVHALYRQAMRFFPRCGLLCRLLWQQKLAAPIFSTPATSETHLYIVTVEGHAHAFAPQSGSLLWAVQLSSPVFAPLLYLVTNTLLIIATQTRGILAHHCSSGAHAWHISEIDQPMSSAVCCFPETQPAASAFCTNAGLLQIFECDAAGPHLGSAVQLPESSFSGPLPISARALLSGCRDDCLYYLSCELGRFI